MKKNQGGGLMALLSALSQDPSNTLVAHIMPSEATALERKNGGGSINPITGLPEFWDVREGTEDQKKKITGALEQIKLEYPNIYKHQKDFAFGAKGGEGDDRYLEYYPPDELYNPVPGKAYQELYPKAMQDEAVKRSLAGDALHFLGGRNPQGEDNDPRFMAMKRAFVDSMTPGQLAVDWRAYERDADFAQKQGMPPRSWDDFREFSRNDAYIRGYLFPDENDEWRKAKAYTPEQEKTLENMKAYLTGKTGGGRSNPITGLPEFWSDGGGEEDGDSIGGGRRGGDEGYSDTERGSSWGGFDGDSGGWGGWGGDGSVGSYSDGISNVDATRAKEAQADMLSSPQSLSDVVNRSAMGEIFSDDQARQDRVKGMWSGATSFRDYPNETRLERGWNRLTRADNVVAGAFGLLGSLTGIPGAGFGLSKLGGYLGKDLTPASTVANLGTTKGTVPGGYAGMGGPTDAASAQGFGRSAGGWGGFGQGYGQSYSGGFGADRDARGESTSVDPWKQDEEAEKKRKDDEEAKKKREQEQKTLINKILGLDEDATATTEEKQAWSWNPVMGWQGVNS